MSTMLQPMTVYPQSTITRHGSNSTGSYVPVIIVLGVISALAVVACYVGQILARRYLRPVTRKNRDFYPAMDTGNEVGMAMPEVMRMMNTSSKSIANVDPKGGILEQETSGMRAVAVPPPV